MVVEACIALEALHLLCFYIFPRRLGSYHSESGVSVKSCYKLAVLLGPYFLITVASAAVAVERLFPKYN